MWYSVSGFVCDRECGSGSQNRTNRKRSWSLRLTQACITCKVVAQGPGAKHLAQWMRGSSLNHTVNPTTTLTSILLLLFESQGRGPIRLLGACSQTGVPTCVNASLKLGCGPPGRLKDSGRLPGPNKSSYYRDSLRIFKFVECARSLLWSAAPFFL